MSCKRFSKRTVKHLCLQSFVIGKKDNIIEFDKWLKKELKEDLKGAKTK